MNHRPKLVYSATGKIVKLGDRIALCGEILIIGDIPIPRGAEPTIGVFRLDGSTAPRLKADEIPAHWQPIEKK